MARGRRRSGAVRQHASGREAAELTAGELQLVLRRVEADDQVVAVRGLLRHDDVEAAGLDAVAAAAADDEVAAGDAIYGDAGDDVLIGGEGGDVLLGGDGVDNITAGRVDSALAQPPRPSSAS